MTLPKFVIRRREPLIAVADVVGLQVVSVGVGVLEDPEPIDRAAVAHVAIALKSRLVRAVAEEVPRTPKSIWLTSGMSGVAAAAVFGDVLLAARPAPTSCAAAPAAISSSAATMMKSLVRITSSCRLPKEFVARRVIRPVDLRVAVHAAAADHAVAGGGDLRAVVDRRRDAGC